MARLPLVLLCLLAATSVHARDTCQQKEVASLELEIWPTGQVFMPARIGEHEVYFQLLLNTGLVILSESAIGPLGLKTQRRTGGTQISIGGKPATHFVYLEKLSVGTMSFARRTTLIQPEPEHQAPQLINGKILAGRMGATLIRAVDLELNFARKEMKVFEPFRCLSKLPAYWATEATAWPAHFDEAGTLVFTLELEGRRIEAGLLGGARNSLIDSRVTRQFFGFDASSPEVEVEAAPGGDGERRSFRAMSLTGRDLEIASDRVELREGSRICKLSASNPVYRAISYSECVNTVPFTLGVDALSKLRLYYSHPRQTIYVTPVP